MVQQGTCSDSECKYVKAGQCIAAGSDHTSKRFCTVGRRRPRDETVIPTAMQGNDDVL